MGMMGVGGINNNEAEFEVPSLPSASSSLISETEQEKLFHEDPILLSPPPTEDPINADENEVTDLNRHHHIPEEQMKSEGLGGCENNP